MRRFERLLRSYCRPANRPVSQSNAAVAATTESVSSKIEITLEKKNKNNSKLFTTFCCHVSKAMSLGAPGLLDGENTDSLGDIDSYVSSARELLHRLHLLEKRQVRSYIHKVTAS